MPSLVIESSNPEETAQIGQLIGSSVLPGTTIGLEGTLGAGKTNLVQAIADALAIDRSTVVSPTFTMIQLYRGSESLVHIDAYRIADEDEFFELGIHEYLEDDSIVAMEWADRFNELLPDDRLTIRIEVVDELRRHISIDWPDQSAISKQVGETIAQKNAGV
jgi:tRNA threonylcarbamoyladenosine biosynthesis protein TsaE